MVLNTCCIRENADQRSTAPSATSRRWARQARPADRRGRMPGPEGPGRIRRRWAGSTWCSARTTWRRRPDCCARARRGAARRDARRARPRGRAATPLLGALRGARARPTPRGSPSRPGATTPAPSASCPRCAGREVSRPLDEIVAEVARAGRRGRHRGDAARPERQLLRARHHAAPPALRRPAARASGRSRGSSASASPAPTRRTCGPRPSRPWPRRPRSASSCTCRCSRAATGCCAPCAGATRAERYLERLAAARAAVDDLAVTTDIIVGFPGETRRRVRRDAGGVRRGAVRQRLHLHLLAARRARGPPPWSEPSSRPTWWPSASSA